MLSPPVRPAAVTAGLGRTLLVLGDDPELATAVRDRLDRAYVTVVEAGPATALDAIGACRPWPWMVIGAGAGPGPGVVDELRRWPILVVWRGEQPPGLPGHTITARLFSEVAAAVEAALRADVAGLRLDIGGGVLLPGGAHLGNATLEALVAAHPRPVAAAPRQVRSAARALAAHHVPLRAMLCDGGAVLVPDRDL